MVTVTSWPGSMRTRTTESVLFVGRENFMVTSWVAAAVATPSTAKKTVVARPRFRFMVALQALTWAAPTIGLRSTRRHDVAVSVRRTMRGRAGSANGWRGMATAGGGRLGFTGTAGGEAMFRGSTSLDAAPRRV